MLHVIQTKPEALWILKTTQSKITDINSITVSDLNQTNNLDCFLCSIIYYIYIYDAQDLKKYISYWRMKNIIQVSNIHIFIFQTIYKHETTAE